MLQLTQVLKYEHWHDSALARFPLRRALRAPQTVGHMFYWFLKAEMLWDVQERFGVLLHQYIRYWHPSFCTWTSVVRYGQTEADCKRVQDEPQLEQAQEIMREELRNVIWPDQFQLPIDPHLNVCGVIVDRCKVMDSKKRPLWLVLKRVGASPGHPTDEDALVKFAPRATKSADGILNDADSDRGIAHVSVMFKMGDDLRQDQLTLQILTVMNDLWLQAGEEDRAQRGDEFTIMNDLDFCVSDYGCISTGDEMGFLEMVPNADACSCEVYVKKAIGQENTFKHKMLSARAAVSDTSVIKQWLSDQHTVGNTRTDTYSR